MMIKDGKKYYTLEESSKILDEMLLEDAKNFAKKVIKKIKDRKEKEENINLKELENV